MFSKLCVPVIFLLFSVQLFGQNVIRGKVISENENSPVSYATISIKNKTIGCIADSLGRFSLKIPGNVKGSDSLFFSSIGYGTMGVRVSEARSEKLFVLEKKNQDLRPVSVSALNQATAGTKDLRTTHYRAWKEIKAGAEIGIRVEFQETPFRVEKIRFKIDNKFDTCIVRLHIRNVRGGKPAEELLTQNIIRTFYPQNILDKDAEFDLSDKNIVIQTKQLFVGFEILYLSKDADHSRSFCFIGTEEGEYLYKYFEGSVWQERADFKPFIRLHLVY